jgi:hypothetical protein
MYHDSFMSVLEHSSGQSANELADILAVRKFPDGNNILEWLHGGGHLKKVATKAVVMTPDSKTMVALDELNRIIAEQKGLASVEDLNPAPVGEAIASQKEQAAGAYSGKEVKAPEVTEESKSNASAAGFELTPSEMRSRADALFKEAQRLRKEADAVDPPKKKAKAEEAEA